MGFQPVQFTDNLTPGDATDLEWMGTHWLGAVCPQTTSWYFSSILRYFFPHYKYNFFAGN